MSWIVTFVIFMAYHFRFESVLHYRRNLEELSRQKLTMAQAQLEKLQSRLDELEELLTQALDAFEERKRQPILAPLYIMLAEGIERREREVANQHKAIAAQYKVVEQSREELIGRVRNRKVMEKAREKDYDNFLQEERRLAQNELDEQMVLRFKRH